MDDGGFFLCVVFTTSTSEVFVGAIVVLVEVFAVELEMLVCPEDSLFGVDFTEPSVFVNLCVSMR